MLFSAAVQTYHHHPNPVLLKPTETTEGAGVPESLVSVCKSSVPKYYPHPLLRNGDLQTCATAIASDHVPIYYKRRLLAADSPDGSDTGTFSIDVVVPPPPDAKSKPVKKQKLSESDPEYFPPRTSWFTKEEFDLWESKEDTTPLVIALHGLSGGSHETYVRLSLEPLVRAKKDGGLGYDALVLNARGCGWTKLTSNKMFNAMFTEDIRQVVKLMRMKFPKRPIMTIGFSLGANILANYLGEEGSSCPVHAAILVSSPHNLDVCGKVMWLSFMGRQYSKFMTGSLRNLFERNIGMMSTHPNIDAEAVRKCVYLFDYDREVTAKIFGFRTSGEYYRASSSVDKLLAVKVPTLIINSEDDPISLKDGYPKNEAQANPYLCFVTTSVGGHLGWFEWNMERWFPKPIVGFFDRMAKLKVVKVAIEESDKFVKVNGVS
ncbi:hypothetical protein ABW20_dc0100767 [Dactylellina cionopaga]|nr:hypothetical protein ABW20_dc0100767 [Dactylellina cionopaga]